jgi:hypothetical protein
MNSVALNIGNKFTSDSNQVREVNSVGLRKIIERMLCFPSLIFRGLESFS